MTRLILFAKRPIRGRVKTRLAPLLSTDQALGLYRAFLLDQQHFMRRFSERAQLELCLDGEAVAEGEASGLRVTEQGMGNLGARLHRAFERSTADGCQATVVIGADSPTLPESIVEAAFEALETSCPAVVAPARDGGYVLIGLRQPVAALFEGIDWGTAAVLDQTLERSRRVGLETRRLGPWYDVDDGAGLRRLLGELRDGGLDDRAPATAAWLRRLDAFDGPMV